MHYSRPFYKEYVMSELSSLPENTPVIIGVGTYQQHQQEPTQCLEAWQLMAEAIRLASVDASPEPDVLLSGINSIAVPQGMWPYKNPAALVAKEVGANNAKSIYATIGIPQLTLLSDACQMVIENPQHIAVITGGEAKYRSLMAQIQGLELQDTADISEPDRSIISEDDLWSDIESERGLVMPTEFYAIMESAMRYSESLDVDAHRTKISKLYQRFSEIAAANPDAWYQEAFTENAIKEPVGKNAMLAFPYTKKHNTQWNVNQAAAIIVTSVAKARELNIAEEKWVFPLANTQSCYAVPVSQRPQLHSHQGTKLAAEKLYQLAGIKPSDIDFVELYSCFPVAVRSYAIDAKLGFERDLTVTGGMPFAGGPLNNFTLQGLVRLTQKLREAPGSKGLISNVSGMITKQSFALLSTTPSTPWQFADVSGETEKTWPPVATDLAFVGDVKVLGYTVVFNKGQPSHAVAVCETPEGKRTVGQSQSLELMQAMMQQEFCGQILLLDEKGQLSQQP